MFKKLYQHLKKMLNDERGFIILPAIGSIVGTLGSVVGGIGTGLGAMGATSLASGLGTAGTAIGTAGSAIGTAGTSALGSLASGLGLGTTSAAPTSGAATGAALNTGAVQGLASGGGQIPAMTASGGSLQGTVPYYLANPAAQAGADAAASSALNMTTAAPGSLPGAGAGGVPYAPGAIDAAVEGANVAASSFPEGMASTADATLTGQDWWDYNVGPESEFGKGVGEVSDAAGKVGAVGSAAQKARGTRGSPPPAQRPTPMPAPKIPQAFRPADHTDALPAPPEQGFRRYGRRGMGRRRGRV